MKATPRFWWDFDKELNIIVQSDQVGGECLATFPVLQGEPDAGARIRQAEALIDDFISGRKKPPNPK